MLCIDFFNLCISLIVPLDTQMSPNFTLEALFFLGPGDKHSRAKPLNVDEEKLLRVFYEYKIQDACQAFNFPHKIQVNFFPFDKVERSIY